MKFALSVNWHFNFNLIVWFKVNVRLPIKDSIKESIEIEFITENIWIEFHIIDNVIEGILSGKFDRFVFFYFIHNFNHYNKRTVAGIGVHADFELWGIILRFKVVDNVVIDLCQKFCNDEEGIIEVKLIPKKSVDNLLESNVFVTVYFFGVVVSNEGTVHSADFELESVFDETTSNKIIILPLETFKFALLFVDGVIHVLLIPFNIISDRSTGSCLYLKYKRSACLIVIVTIDLWT